MSFKESTKNKRIWVLSLYHNYGGILCCMSLLLCISFFATIRIQKTAEDCKYLAKDYTTMTTGDVVRIRRGREVGQRVHLDYVDLHLPRMWI